MKIAARFLLIIVLGGATVLLSNCKGSDPKPPKEKTSLEKLAGTWNLTSVTLEGVTRNDFTGITLALSGTYVADGGTYGYVFTGVFPKPSPMPKSGDWRFGDNPETQMIRSIDNLPMGYTLSSNNTELEITFNYPTSGAGFAGGRTGEVHGNWVWKFTKA